MAIVKTQYVVQKPVEGTGFFPDSPDGWDDILNASWGTQAAAVKRVQDYPSRPVRTIKREVTEVLITEQR